MIIDNCSHLSPISLLLNLRFDREHSHETNPESFPEAGVGINAQSLLLVIDQTVPGYFLTTLVVTLQFQSESNLINFPVKTTGNSFYDLFGLEYDTDFGILNYRPGVEVQLADENLFAVKHKCFGMQACPGVANTALLHLFPLFFAQVLVKLV